jgi:hypothetical protein
MKVNLFRVDTSSDHLVLKVADAPFDITDVLFNFLAHVPEVNIETLEVIEMNTIQFATESILEEDYKDWKLSVINNVREMLTQDEDQLKEHYLVSHQQLEAIEKEFREAQAQLLHSRLELIVSKKYNEKIMAITGLAIIVAFVAIMVAIVGVLI